MKAIFSLAFTFCLCVPAAAQTALKCPELIPKIRSLKISRMQPQRRGREWLEGSPKNVNSVACDLYGMKTEEAEYDGKHLVLKNSYIYREKAEKMGAPSVMTDDKKARYLKREEVRTMEKDISRLREAEAETAREKISQIKTGEEAGLEAQ